MIGIDDRPLRADEVAAFQQYRQRGMTVLSAAESSEPKELVRAINEYVDAWQSKRRGFLSRLRSRTDDATETARALSVVWGDQIIRRFGWEWICEIQGDEERYAVAPADRAVVIHAPEFITECFDQPNTDCTVLLAFNMQEAGKFSDCPAREYVSVMSGIRRIVPKR